MKSRKRIVKYWLVIFIPIFVVVSALPLLFIYSDYEVERKLILNEAIDSNKLIETELYRDIERAFEDALYLASNHELREMTGRKGRSASEAMDDLINDYFTFMKTRRGCQRVTLLGRKGDEIFSIDYNNGHPLLASAGGLRHVKSRATFSVKGLFSYDLLSFVSSRQLSGQRSRGDTSSYRPILRVGLNLFRPASEKVGTLVIYCWIKSLRNKFTYRLTTDFMMIDNDGRYVNDIHGKHRSTVSPPYAGDTFVKDFPKALPAVSKSLSGHVVAAKGFLAYTTIDLSDIAESVFRRYHHGDAGEPLYSDKGRHLPYKLISFVPRDKFDGAYYHFVGRLLVFSPILIFLSAAISFFLAFFFSKRRMAEKELLESSIKSRKITETAIDGIIIAQGDGTMVETNRSADRMFGYEKGAMLGRPLIDIIPEKYRASHLDGLSAFMKTGKGAAIGNIMELEGIRSDGESFPIELVIGHFNLKERVYFTGTIRDISERVSQEKALASSEERYRKIVELSPNLVSIYVGGRLEYINKAGAAMLGASMPSELKGKEWVSFVTSSRRQSIEDMLNRVIESGEIIAPMEEQFVRIDGGCVDLLVTAMPWLYYELRGVLIIASNITLEKMARREVMRHDKLESLGILAGGIAHDFNNILAAILGNISIIKYNTSEVDKNHKRLNDAENACLSAKGLTRQLLTFARGGAPVKELASVESIIKETSSFVLKGSNVILKYLISDNMWSVQVDKGQLGQVITNMVINANQAMPEGGVVTIKADNVSFGDGDIPALGGGDYVRIQITDRGTGISPDNLIKIFDPYFTTKQTGTGLGLAICYSVIRNHMGTIRVNSVEGKGTSFFIYLPASERKHEERKKEKRRIKAMEGKGRILVMDDEERVREVCEDMLESIGYRCEVCSDGGEAIRRYRETFMSGKAFDAVIMDLTIPGEGMGGREAVQELVRIDPDAKVIVSSGYSDDIVMENFRQYGFSAMISKPYTVDELVRVLNEILVANA